MSKEISLGNIPLPKLILQVKQTFKEEDVLGDEIKYKQKLFDKFKKIILSSEIWRAYFLPNDTKLLQRYENRIRDLWGDDVYTLKESALHILDDIKSLEKIADITDPLHETSQTITLALLETLLLLQDEESVSKISDKKISLLTDIADNFGLWKIRYILEDEAFRFKHPDQYKIASLLLQKQTDIHKKLFADMISIIEYQFKKEGLQDFKIVYRKKNIYGIYRKIQSKGQNINQITDLFAFRIIVKTIPECYQVLEILHRLWPHYAQKLKDFIEHPKPNQYQSIHTTLQCLEKNIVEFQIRTEGMDAVAKFGPASHALYKSLERKQFI